MLRRSSLIPLLRASRGQVALPKYIFSSSVRKDITRVPLSQPISLSEDATESAAKNNYTPFDAEVSTLPNGIRVATEQHYGDYVTVGVAIKSGARYGVSYPYGITHHIEKLAFASTARHEHRDSIYSVLEQSGALVDCQATKDSFIYAASCHRSGLPQILEIIANTAWRPRITADELEEVSLTVQYEVEDMGRRIESIEPLLTEWMHQAAFRGNTLGLPKFTPEENYGKISRSDILSYLSQYHQPGRIVVAGVGVPHSELCSLVSAHFNESETTWTLEGDQLRKPLPPIDKSLAQYTGGEVRVERDLSKIAIGTPYPNLAHVALGFEGCGYKDPDFVPFCVLQSLLGGGGSFSAGGPGKGMYTRMYVDVLNRHHWMYGATAFNHSYADAGVFNIHASADPSQIGDALVVLLDQFFYLLQGAEKEELQRAKIQLKSQLMMNLEVRPVMFEDLARQVMGHGRRRSPYEYMQLIDQVTSSDIVRVAERMLAGKPSLVGYGELAALHSYDRLDKAVANRDIKSLLEKKKFSWQ